MDDIPLSCQRLLTLFRAHVHALEPLNIYFSIYQICLLIALSGTCKDLWKITSVDVFRVLHAAHVRRGRSLVGIVSWFRPCSGSG